MGRRKYLKDYRIVETLNERGGIRSTSEYIGEAYRFRDPAAAEGMKKPLPVFCGLSWLAFFAALLPYSSAGCTAYTVLPLLFSAIPLGMLTERALVLLRQKPPLEHRSADRFNDWIPGASLTVCILSGVSLAGELVNLFFGAIPLQRGDALFTASALTILACGLAIRRRRLRLQTEPAK